MINRSRAAVVLLGISALTGLGCGGSVARVRPKPTLAVSTAGLHEPPTEELDPLLAMPTLFRVVNDARVAVGAAPLQIDSTLTVVAKRALGRYLELEAGSEQQVAITANAEVNAVSLLYDTVFTQVLFSSELRAAASALQHAIDPQMTSVGMGVARCKSRAQTGFAVVVILGESQPGSWYAGGQQL